MLVGIVEPVGGHGGMDYYDYGLSSGLANSGVEVHLYTSDETQERTFENVRTIKVFKGLWKASLIVKVYRYLSGHFCAYKSVKVSGGEIVHLHFFVIRIVDLMALALAKTMRLKTVVTIHDINGFDQTANRIIERLSYNLIDKIIVHNKTSAKLLLKKNDAQMDVSIIPHGNYNPFISRLPDEPRERFTLLFFGQIKKVKGLEVLLSAVRHLKDEGVDIQLIVAGKPWKSDLDYYKQLILDLDIGAITETHFRFIPDNEVSVFFSRADLVVLPYKEIYQSGVLLLTLSYGKPVLCSNLDAFKEIIEDGITGYLFKEGDDKDLALKINTIIANKGSLGSITKNSSALVSTEHSWDLIGEKTCLLYKSLREY